MTILPPIRTDLTLDSTPTFIEGQPSYLLIDPIANEYFRLSKKTLLLLTHWQQIPPAELLELLNSKYPLDFTEQDLQSTLTFLQQHQLLLTTDENGIAVLLEKKIKNRTHWFETLLSHYLFFKIPLIKPDFFLSKTAPWINKLFSRGYLYLLIVIAMIGIYLTINQFYAFFQPFDHFFSLEGMIYLFIGMAIIKTVHELGHAYAAQYFGCHVNSIGVAFLVMFPILYTDTSDAWRLKNYRQRLIIDCAGVMAELQLMIWLLLFWHLVDNLILKNIIVYAITVGLFSTLLVNLNPLMRFDGYYALSNFLQIDNLQPHSFALARWKLREWLIGLKVPPPYQVGHHKLNIMLIYAYITWIYRFFLFTGIAFLVYYLFFKVLGIFLFLVEMYYFILGPILSELKIYVKNISNLKFNTRIAITSFCLFSVLFLLLFPWRSTLIAPAVLTFEKKKDIYTNRDGFANSIPIGNHNAVPQDNLIFLSSSPDLAYKKKFTEIKIQQLKIKIKQQYGEGLQLGPKQNSLSELNALQNQLDNITEEQNRLTLRAPFEGIIYNRSPNIMANRWYKYNSYLFSIAEPTHWAVRAYIPEYAMSRIDYIQAPFFLSDNPETPTIPLLLKQKSLTNTDNLNSPYLASIYLGPLSVYPKSEREGALALKESYYEFLFTPLNQVNTIHFEQRGVIVMKVARQSLVKRFYLHVMSLLIRESGF